jgi:hypothetical protein
VNYELFAGLAGLLRTRYEQFHGRRTRSIRSPRRGYFLLDERRIPVEALDADNLATCLMRIERNTGTQSVREALGALKKLLANKKYQPLNRAFAVWIIRVLQNRKVLKEFIPEVNNIAEVDTMFAESVDEWTKQWKMEGLQEGRQEGREEGLQEGREEGLQEGRQEMLYITVRNALRKQMSHDDIADLTGLSLEEIQRIASDLLQ